MRRIQTRRGREIGALALFLGLILALTLSGAGAASSAPATSGSGSTVLWRNEGFHPEKGWTTGEVGPYGEGDLVPFRLTVTNPSNYKTAVVGGFSLQVTNFAHGVTVFESTTDWAGPVAPSSQDGSFDDMLRTTFPAGLTLAPGQSATFTFKGRLAVSAPGRPAAGMLNGNGVRGFSEVDAAGVGSFGKRVPVKVSPGQGTLGTPAIDIAKTSDAATEGVRPGTLVTYRYAVTNIGDVPLYDVAVTDDVLGQIGTIAGPMAPGATQTLTRAEVVNETTTNKAAVTAVDRYGRQVSDTAELTVSVLSSARVFGSVFNDVDVNGAWDAGEPGLDGRTIELSDEQGNVIAATTTATDGSYSFDGLTPGTTYTISFVPYPGWIQSAPQGGTFTVTPAPGQDAGPFDFGDYIAPI